MKKQKIKSLYALTIDVDELNRDAVSIYVEWGGYDALHDEGAARALGNPTLREWYKAQAYASGILARIAVAAAALDDEYREDVPETPSASRWQVRASGLVRPYLSRYSPGVRFDVMRKDAAKVKAALEKWIAAATTVIPAYEDETGLDEPITGRLADLADSRSQSADAAHATGDDANERATREASAEA